MRQVGWLILVPLAMLLAPTPPANGDDPQTAALMTRKLTQSQKLLEGIALSDFAKMQKHAEELSAVSRAAAFRVLQTPLYQVYSADFQRTAETLARQARDKNLDGAALSYVELTLTCVKCHKHVREVRMARLDRP